MPDVDPEARSEPPALLTPNPKPREAVSAASPRVLLLYGGWPGHAPAEIAQFACDHLLADCEVVRSESVDDLTDDNLKTFDLILPIWTFGSLPPERENSLLRAVEHGLGYVGWHGNASAFLASRAHKFLLGGQFVAHPGGEQTRYTVTFNSSDPLTAELGNITLTSEQYYLLVDPAVDVLATSRIDGGGMDWIAGVQMPAAWKRRWGQGRVFYCALGHSVDVLELRPVRDILKRGVAWASRRSACPF